MCGFHLTEFDVDEEILQFLRQGNGSTPLLILSLKVWEKK